MSKDDTRLQDISKPLNEQLVKIRFEDLMPLPAPFKGPEDEPPLTDPKPDWKKDYVTELDGYIGIDMPMPKNGVEEKELVQKFLNGLKKLLSENNNWEFLQPLMLSFEYCAQCQTCSDACPVYLSSGKKEIYRPTYRAEIVRRIIKKYLTKSGKIFGKFVGADIELNANTVLRLAEDAYRCTLCRRCAQRCPIGVDNGLITHEIRKLFSAELGIAPKPLHELGTVQHLEKGSSTGLTPEGFADIIEFIEDDIEEKIGKRIKIPVDEKGADILLIHNAGEYLSWPENPAAFAILFEEAGLSWTLSSEMVGYDGVNYGVWYDDVQLARVALKHAEIARKLDVNKIVIGECGHAHKAITIIADRVFHDEYNIPRESCLTLLWDLYRKGRFNLDPDKNDFPVTLHDPCNVVRLMGIVEPQRKILRAIAPQFREMSPNGVYNYCCGGGSGFAIMQSMNFPEFRNKLSARMKVKQVLEAFSDCISPDINKYFCLPCSNCKGATRDAFVHYGIWDKCRIIYSGLVELMVNAMVDLEEPFVEWEWH
jgi:Fe-S oxidoreductase